MKDFEDDRSAILDVLRGEQSAYMNRNYEAWEKFWLEGPETRRLHAHPGTGVTLLQGDSIRAHMREILAENTVPLSQESIRIENLNLNISATMAWVSYDLVGDTSGTLTEMAGVYHELKILHKTDGEWKIACIAGAQRRIDHVETPLIEVDASARIIWANSAATERLPVHPRLRRRGEGLQAVDPGAQRALLDALEWLVDVRDHHAPCLGHDNVNRAVALGQDDEDIARICWAILQDGKLLVAFDDPKRLEVQIARASAVYGMSGAQSQLSRLLVEGHDLSAASEIMGISANTARTHLRRVFDKTGVRTQSALVRILLSAEPVSV